MTFDPQKTYLALHGAGEARPIAVDDSFWPDVMAGKHPELDKGWLVGAYPMEADWPEWEMHPEGEEVLTLLSGELEMIVDEGGTQTTITMKPGRTFVMPRGAWHRALVKTPCLMLGITWGRGTQHRPVEAAAPPSPASG
jgi:mannose-6-phosphate isomerase-like protein (cupin superfamily)